jgi:spore maturation protein SpmA
MKIGEAGGAVKILARLVRPLFSRLFPGVPSDHPANASMLMNMSANMLGLDNAATPFGLQAMKELDELNPQKGTATNAMATFLTINTSSVTLVPIAIIGLRVANESEDPAAPLFGILMATMVSTIVGVTAVRMLEKLPMFAIKEELTVPEGEGV